jgi:hypothetical protein
MGRRLRNSRELCEGTDERISDQTRYDEVVTFGLTHCGFGSLRLGSEGSGRDLGRDREGSRASSVPGLGRKRPRDTFPMTSSRPVSVGKKCQRVEKLDSAKAEAAHLLRKRR